MGDALLWLPDLIVLWVSDNPMRTFLTGMATGAVGVCFVGLVVNAIRGDDE